MRGFADVSARRLRHKAKLHFATIPKIFDRNSIIHDLVDLMPFTLAKVQVNTID